LARVFHRVMLSLEFLVDFVFVDHAVARRDFRIFWQDIAWSLCLRLRHPVTGLRSLKFNTEGLLCERQLVKSAFDM
jgi:hypothetical protein